MRSKKEPKIHTKKELQQSFEEGFRKGTQLANSAPSLAAALHMIVLTQRISKKMLIQAKDALLKATHD